MRADLIELAVEQDDIWMEKYLDGTTPTEEEIKNLIRKGTIASKFVPVLCGSAFKNKGVQPMLDAVVDFESTDMYFESRFESLRGIDKINPLFVINNYVKQSNNDRFTIAEFANSMRLSESQLRSYLFPLVDQCFLFYDSSNDFFVVHLNFIKLHFQKFFMPSSRRRRRTCRSAARRPRARAARPWRASPTRSRTRIRTLARRPRRPARRCRAA